MRVTPEHRDLTGIRRGRPPRGLLALAVAAGFLVSTAGPAEAWRPFVTPQGKYVRWDAATLFVRGAAGWGESLDAAAVAAAIVRATAAWEDPRCAEPAFDVIAPFEDAALDDADGRVSIVPIADKATWDARFGALELARTLITYRVTSGAMVDADIAVNIGGFAFAGGEGCDPERYDFQAMLTHELGHVLGLDHSGDEGATMFQRTDPGDCDIRALAADDLEGLCALYPPPPPAADDPPEPGPEPGPEPAPEPIAEMAAAEPIEFEPVGGRPGDWGCGGAGGAPTAWLLWLAPLFSLRRRVARATARDRRGPRHAPAR